jgi:hypothetical protein
MSDESPLSKLTRPSLPSKEEMKGRLVESVGVTSGGSGDPTESQVPEPPPGGGQQPGDEIHKGPPTSNS